MGTHLSSVNALPYPSPRNRAMNAGTVVNTPKFEAVEALLENVIGNSQAKFNTDDKQKSTNQ